MASLKGVNLAKHLGITPGRVSQLKSQGMPVDSYDSATSWYQTKIDQKLSPKLTPGIAMPKVSRAAAAKVAEIIEGAYDLQAARAKREHHEANLAELKERQALGELVEANRVTRAVTTWAAMARAAFEKVPDKVSDSMAAISFTASRCSRILRRFTASFSRKVASRSYRSALTSGCCRRAPA